MKKDDLLLNYIYNVANMGYRNTLNLYSMIEGKGNKIKSVVSEIKDHYYDFKKEASKLMKEEKNSYMKDLMTEACSSLGMRFELMKDNSDSRVAQILIQGFTMGILEIDKNISDYQDKSQKDVVKFAKKLKVYQQEKINDLKVFL